MKQDNLFIMDANSIVINFTWYTSKTPLSKIYFRDESNCIQVKYSNPLFNSYASYISIPFTELPDYLSKANEFNALTSGVFDKLVYGGNVKCLSGTKFIEFAQETEYDEKSLNLPGSKIKIPAITRSNMFIKHDYNEGNGLVILDIDAPAQGDIINPSKLYDLLCGLIPGFNDVLCFSVGSSSSRIVGLEKNGYRIYFPSSTPLLIPSFIKNLFAHMEQAGHGWVDIGASGNLRSCTYIDRALHSPPQLDLCGPAIVGDGISIKPLAAFWHNAKGGTLDCGVLTELSARAITKITNKKHTTKIKALREVEAGKFKIIKEQEYLNYLDNKDDSSANEVEIKRRQLIFELNHNKLEWKVKRSGVSTRLDATFVLQFEHYGKVTVEEALKHPRKYNGCQLADPVEGINYSSGLQCAIFYMNEGSPIISSRAHGGIYYELDSLVRPAHKEVPALPIDEASNLLNEEVLKFFKVRTAEKESLDNFHKTIVATPGLGKTRAVFNAANEMKRAGRRLLVHLYIPTHKLADELATNMSEIFPDLNISVRKGRAVDGFCEKYEQVQPFEGVVPSMMKAFCNDGEGGKCSNITRCRYIAQFREEFDVLILPHQYLNFPLPKSESKPTVVVIDECFYNVITGHQAYDARALKDVLTTEGCRGLSHAIEGRPKDNYGLYDLWVRFFIGKRPSSETSEEALSSAIDSVNNEHKCLKVFIEKYNKSAENSISKINPVEDKEWASTAHSYFKSNKSSYRLACVLDSILEHKNDYSFFSCINNKLYLSRYVFTTLFVDDRPYYFNDPLNQQVEKSRYTKFLLETPILCIDGGASESISNVLLQVPKSKPDYRKSEFFSKPEFVQIAAQRKLCVTQCNSRVFSQFSLTDSDDAKELIDDVVKVIGRTVDSNYAVYKEDTLLVTYKTLNTSKNKSKSKNEYFYLELKKLNNWGHLKIIHFNALRGIDFYKNHHVIILGRNEPPNDEVLLQSESLFKRLYKSSNKQYLLDYGFLKGRFAAYNTGAGVDINKGKGAARYFNKEIPNTILKQIRENESAQAIARVRDVRSESYRQVLILSSLALDIQVDRIFTWPELNVKKQKQCIMDFYEKHDGIFVRSPALLNQQDAGISRDQWKDIVKIEMDRYVLPLGEYDIQMCKKLSDASDGKDIDFNQHLSTDRMSKVVLKVPKKRNPYQVVYDSSRHSEESVAFWLNNLFAT